MTGVSVLNLVIVILVIIALIAVIMYFVRRTPRA